MKTAAAETFKPVAQFHDRIEHIARRSDGAMQQANPDARNADSSDGDGKLIEGPIETPVVGTRITLP